MKRKIIQIVSLISLNSYIKGFINRVNYGGALKRVCIPVINCWSCPSALTGCPIGAIEVYVKSGQIPFIPLLYIIVPGLLLGRFFCGFICPAGFIQELIFRLKTKKLKLNNGFTFLPILSLVFGVIIFSYVFSNAWFSRYLCPMGTLQASIPWVILDEGVRSNIGGVFVFKIFFLIFVALFSVFIYRFFCRTLCPLGFILGIFNKIAFLKIKYDRANCDLCEGCKDVCPVDLKIPEEVNNFKCIRCMNCVNICRKSCLKV
ncbi:MAG: 4Fe-4S binding protein [Proteobacteria bacterium]|nr:4Fe-4S binding protein [Pseudomonadota bacterium]